MRLGSNTSAQRWLGGARNPAKLHGLRALRCRAHSPDPERSGRAGALGGGCPAEVAVVALRLAVGERSARALGLPLPYPTLFPPAGGLRGHCLSFQGIFGF